MGYLRISHTWAALMAVGLLLSGCQAPETAIPPTLTPPPLITSAEMLIGSWEPLAKTADSMFLQINADGACRQSFTLDGLTDAPEVECTYTFEETDLAMTAVKLNNVSGCPSLTGKYEVWSLAEDQIQLVTRQDTCLPRIRSTSGKYQRLP